MDGSWGSAVHCEGLESLPRRPHGWERAGHRLPASPRMGASRTPAPSVPCEEQRGREGWKEQGEALAAHPPAGCPA